MHRATTLQRNTTTPAAMATAPRRHTAVFKPLKTSTNGQEYVDRNKAVLHIANLIIRANANQDIAKANVNQDSAKASDDQDSSKASDDQDSANDSEDEDEDEDDSEDDSEDEDEDEDFVNHGLPADFMPKGPVPPQSDIENYKKWHKQYMRNAEYYTWTM